MASFWNAKRGASNVTVLGLSLGIKKVLPYVKALFYYGFGINFGMKVWEFKIVRPQHVYQ